jgi:hydrogenase maturation protease
MKTIVVGLGNPILGDDGVGWKVAEEVRKELNSSSLLRPSYRDASQSPTGRGVGGEGVDVEFLSIGGISLMEHLIGYQHAILIDAVNYGRATGSIIVCQLDEMPDHSAFHMTGAHDTSLQNALKLGKAIGADLPEHVTVVGIGAQLVHEFGEELSSQVAQAIPRAVQIVMHLL